MTEFMYLETTIEKKMFVKFLQNLENIMKEFSEVVDWKVVLFLKKHSGALENSLKKLRGSFFNKAT